MSSPPLAESSSHVELLHRELLEREHQSKLLEDRAGHLGNLRLVNALAAIAFLLLPLYTKNAWPWIGFGLSAILFVVLGVTLDRVLSRCDRQKKAAHFYRESLARIQDDWKTLPDDGLAFRGMENRALYAEDLDVFGPSSLFQLLCHARTSLGQLKLASWLQQLPPIEDAHRRQGLVNILASEVAFRESLYVAASFDSKKPLQEAPLLSWAESLPPIPNERLISWVARLQPVLLTVSFLTVVFGAPKVIFLISLTVHVLIILGTRGWVLRRLDLLSGPERTLSRYKEMIERIEQLKIKEPHWVDLQRAFGDETTGPRTSASGLIRQLSRYVELLEARFNMFFAFTLGPWLLWELNIVLIAEHWRRAHGKRLRLWLDAVGEVEAVASIAALRFERPHYTFPSFVKEVRFVASGLSHPLLNPKHAVPNDVSLKGPGFVLLLSGSNMSGKSTLLRAIGTSVVLARIGAPVPATQLELSPLILGTSIRVSDSLAKGISHFYAELLRLREILNLAQSGGQLLFLLDEMLHGTNSQERYLGARYVIRKLHDLNAMGVVTTHDLSLGDVEQDVSKESFRHQHLADRVEGEQMIFDYTLKEGPLTSTNALRLMKSLGIEV